VVATTRRRRPAQAIVAAMPTAEPFRARVEIDRGVTPISGRIAAEGAAERPFSGWTELCAALDAALAGDRATHATDEGVPDAEVL
jgi:hypothetical protein